MSSKQKMKHCRAYKEEPRRSDNAVILEVHARIASRDTADELFALFTKVLM